MPYEAQIYLKTYRMIDDSKVFKRVEASNTPCLGIIQAMLTINRWSESKGYPIIGMGICLIQMPAAIKCCSKKSHSLPLEESNVEEEQMFCHAKNIMKKIKTWYIYKKCIKYTLQTLSDLF